jgi:hypothetical protein
MPSHILGKLAVLLTKNDIGRLRPIVFLSLE